MKSDQWIKQIRYNLVSDLLDHSAPVMEIKAVLSDRVLFEKTPEFLLWIQSQTCERCLFRLWPYPFYKNHGGSAIRSWRQNTMRWSMQVTEHPDLIEVDIDSWNPDYGLLPLIAHGIDGNLIQTSPFRVMKGLRKLGVPVPDARREPSGV